MLSWPSLSLPFNEHNIAHFRPLYHKTAFHLNAFPPNTTADAAFDVRYVYACAARRGGIGAVPLNQHGHPSINFLSMVLRFTPETCLCLLTPNSTHRYRAQRFRCPPTSPNPPELPALPALILSLPKNRERGRHMRAMLNREGPLYHAIYTQRTSCECISSQAKELGIERPRVRNISPVHNLHTLIYLIINGRALHRAKSIKRGLLQMI